MKKISINTISLLILHLFGMLLILNFGKYGIFLNTQYTVL